MSNEPWQRMEQIGDCTLYLGDCRKIMPCLRGVDAVVTDPPYGTNVTEWDSDIGVDTMKAIADMAGGYSVWFYSNTRLAQLLTALRETGRDTWVAVWHKSNAMGFERRFAPQWTPIVIAYKGRPQPKFWGQDYFHCPITVQKIDHPTPKQLGITEWLVERSAREGQVIFDPFMGSGTTGVACARRGRRFIGIELEPKYFEIACDRLRDAVAKAETSTLAT